MSTPLSSQSSQPTNQAAPAAHVPAGDLVSPDRVSARRVLVSVYDKTSLFPLAYALADAGVEIVSTGSTTATITAASPIVTPMEEVIGSLECLKERVRTSHPAVHVGILVDRHKPDHLDQLATLGMAPVDLVIVNLYPFADTVISGAPFDTCIKQINIGGPTTVRAAAKNHPAIAVVTSPGRYGDVIAAIRESDFTLSGRRRLVAEAFTHVAVYDAAVSIRMTAQTEANAASYVTNSADVAEVEAGGPAAPPAYVGVGYERLANLCYGENPRQRTAVYRIAGTSEGITGVRQLYGKAVSYNNYTNTDAAAHAAYDHGPAVTVAVVKHASPCDIAVLAAGDVAETHRRVHACDLALAYGGVIATDTVITAEMARRIRPTSIEVVVVPAFDDEAVEILSTRENLRLSLVEAPQCEGYEIKQVSGGTTIQERGVLGVAGDGPSTWTLATGPIVDNALLANLAFAWRPVRVVRSNAVLPAHGGTTAGMGMGQVNRVDSCKLAIERANALGARSTGDAAFDGSQQGKGIVGGADAANILAGIAIPQRARGAMAASDTFFPFADGLQVLVDARVHAVVQPGGSIRDQEVIDAAQAVGVTMHLIGIRHSSH